MRGRCKQIPGRKCTWCAVLRGSADVVHVRSVHSVHCTYVNKDGSETKAVGKVGENMLRVAHENGVDLEGTY